MCLVALPLLLFHRDPPSLLRVQNSFTSRDQEADLLLVTCVSEAFVSPHLLIDLSECGVVKFAILKGVHIPFFSVFGHSYLIP